MNSWKRLLFLVGIGFSTILESHITQGLECYVCNSAFDEGCDKSPPPDRYKTECSPNTAQPQQFKVDEVKARSNETIKVAESGSAGSSTGNKSSAAVQLHQKLENGLTKENEVHFARLVAENANYTFCRKTITKIPRQHNKDNVKEATSRITRSCGWIVEPKKMNSCRWSDINNIKLEYCTCSENDCNGAVSRTLYNFIYVPCIITIMVVSRFICN